MTARKGARSEIPTIPDNAVLRKGELMTALDIGEELLEQLIKEGKVPAAYLSNNTPRFVYGQVVRALARIADPADPWYRSVPPTEQAST